MNGYVYLAALLFLEIGAEFFVHQSLTRKNKNFIFPAVLFYILIPLCLYGLIRSFGNNLTVANTIWQVSNVVIVALVGVSFFGDKLSTVQWIALVLATIASALMAFGPKLDDDFS